MKQKFFRIPVANPDDTEADLNAFCDQHRVSNVDKQFVADAANSFWAVCVTWSDNEGSLAGNSFKRTTNPKTGKIDYKEVLNDDDFIVFSRLRELRKTIAERDGIAAYNVFTNEQLAAIVQRRISSKTALMEADGIGQTRADKYGDAFIECLQTLVVPNPADETHPDHP
ncbi:HRDC domain-containing protein [Thiothrix winogradskyi]|uniref:HRDC domain-containing protein n=1 Tax=Thiothrix winogradskyi TaxID=96472 RepID=A0ABY3SX82_9GAMM|nr:HRDC domain-containing protein [Thiothrix winogradskyi]UJS23111.1 HRDC domain-containing protein [Thiothrix winogradskyi]